MLYFVETQNKNYALYISKDFKFFKLEFSNKIKFIFDDNIVFVDLISDRYRFAVHNFCLFGVCRRRTVRAGAIRVQLRG